MASSTCRGLHYWTFHPLNTFQGSSICGGLFYGTLYPLNTFQGPFIHRRPIRTFIHERCFWCSFILKNLLCFFFIYCTYIWLFQGLVKDLRWGSLSIGALRNLLYTEGLKIFHSTSTIHIGSKGLRKVVYFDQTSLSSYIYRNLSIYPKKQ